MKKTDFIRKERQFYIMKHQWSQKLEELKRFTDFIKGDIESIQVCRDNAKVWLQDGRKFYWDFNHFHSLGALMRDGFVEPTEYRTLKKIIMTGNHVIDIGANFGWYSTLFSRWVGDEGKVYSFEPLPDVFCELNNNIELNNLKNIETFPFAISDEEGSAVISFPVSLGSEYASIATTKIAEREYEAVCEVTRLDKLVEDIGIAQVDFIKIDVEGNEINVLKGAEQTLLKYKPSLMIEVYEDQLERFNTSPSGIAGFLYKLGYSIYIPVNGELMEADISDLCGSRNVFCIYE